jgi:lantibiotic biosynthesis protein
MEQGANHRVDFFVLRTPALPIEDLLEWGMNLGTSKLYNQGADQAQVEQSWQEDVQTLRKRLAQIIRRPEVRQALLVASPSLELGLDYWLRDPASKKGRQAERALVRYFTRMCARSTPFGLFSGCSVGRAILDSGDGSVLKLRPRSQYRVSSRLNFDYLWQLSAVVCQENDVANDLRYQPNSSLHRFADIWRYLAVETPEGGRKYRRMAIEDDLYLPKVLQCARGGATIHELTRTLSAQGSLDEEHSASYIRHLIDRKVLVPDFGPSITGDSAIDDLIGQLELLPSRAEIADTLRWTRDHLQALDREGIGAAPEKHRLIGSRLKTLPIQLNSDDLYQLDLIKPVQDAALAKTVIEEIHKGVEVLRRLGQRSEPDALHSLRVAFTYRYDRAAVPLLEALDEESGIGFGNSNGSSPLIHELRTSNPSYSSSGPLNPFLLQEVVDCLQQSSTELELKASNLPPINALTPLLPDSFAVMATLLAHSDEALHQGEFQLKIEAVWGPDGARYLARFCHADPELHRLVREHLKQEEACHPEAVYAEIAHLPEEKMGNILHRPVLREHEIVYLARSSAPLDQQLPVSDLLLAVEKGRFVLYSQRLGRQIIPRLTSAHGYMNPQLNPVYRFLCLLQRQGGTHIGKFSWGALNTLKFLPRLKVGRLILSAAQWRLAGSEIAKLGEYEGFRRFVAVNELRHQYGWPRWMVLEDSDQSLTVDMDNPLSVDAFVHVLKRESHAVLREMLPSPEDLCVRGPEGHYCHELCIPFVRSQAVAAQRAIETTLTAPDAKTSREADARIRTLPLGSSWLYIKVYGGPMALDELLVRILPSLIHTGITSGTVDSWFYLRFTDPHHHLRIRFHGDPDRLRLELLPLLNLAVNPLLSSGKIWKIQFDTYEREVERYGGIAAVLAAEEIFFYDSSAVLDVLQTLHKSGHGPDRRWEMALIGSDVLLSDFGFDLPAKRLLMKELRHKYAYEFRATGDLQRLLGEKFRVNRSQLEQLWSNVADDNTVPELVRQAFQTRSNRSLSAIHALRALFREGKLRTDLTELAATFVHMHINRMMESSWRHYECILYEFLYRLYDSRLARLSKESK